MKTLFILALGLFSINSFALEYSSKVPVFTKLETPGFAPAEYQNSQKCEIYRYKVVKTMGVGPMQTKEQKRVQLTGPALKLMEKVINAQRDITPGPSDIPSTSYSLGYVEDNTTMDLTFNQRGFTMIKTEGQAAKVLKNFIDKICK